MRPAGEIRQALLNAALALATPERSPTVRELADYAVVGRDAARRTVDNMCRAGLLQVPRTRRVDYRNRPVAEYCAAEPVNTAQACAALSSVLGQWAGVTA